MRFQEKHLFDLTLHYFQIEDCRNAPPRMKLICRTILLPEAGESKNADAIRLLLNNCSATNINALLRNYGLELDNLRKRFTLVTVWCAVMPNVVRASVSQRGTNLDERWMGWTLHMLNTIMKHCIDQCGGDEILSRVPSDLKVVKTIVRIFKQSGWNNTLPTGYSLIQKVETRLAAKFSVAERFIKSASFVADIIDKHNSNPAQEAWDSIWTTTDDQHKLRMPVIQAVYQRCISPRGGSSKIFRREYLSHSTFCYADDTRI